MAALSDFPGTNAIPAEQAQVQMTVCPNWHDLVKSYKLRGTSDTTAPLTYFQPKSTLQIDPVEYFHIKQNEIVWCLKKDLIGTNIATSAFHPTNKSKVLKVRSSFNNYVFPPEIQLLINYLSSGRNHCNEKYISEVVASAIMPLGFSKSQFTFIDRAMSGVDMLLEINCGGTIQAYVRDPDDSLRVETKCRIAVPTPTLWNNTSKFYKDREHIQGKINLYLQSMTANKDKKRLESIFQGFFGNDSMRVESRLKHIIDCGHASMQPLYGIPVFFVNLVSTIVIDTYQRGISTGFLKLNNKFKYAHILQAYKDLAAIIPNKQSALFALIQMIFENIKTESEEISLLVIATINLMEAIGVSDGALVTAVGNAYAYVGKGFSTDDRKQMDHLLRLFDNYTLDIKLETSNDYVPSNGNDEETWANLLKSHGDEALDWSDIFYFNALDKNPLSKQYHNVAFKDQIGMHGTYDMGVLHDPVHAWHTISEEKLMDKRHLAAMNFTTIAAQVFNLAIPCESRSASGDALESEGHLFRHRNDPHVAPMIQECTSRAYRFSHEICKTLMSEILPVDQREIYRTGFDHQQNQNGAMVVDHHQNFTFDNRSVIGRVSESLSEVFSYFTGGLAEFFLADKNKMVMTVIEPNVKGNRAVTYVKQ